MTKPKNTDEVADNASDEIADDNYDTDDSYTDETPAPLPMTPDSVSSSGIPARTRKTSTYELWTPVIEELRTTALGQSYCYNNVAGVSGITQGLRKHFGITAASRNVITSKMVEKGTAKAEDVGKGTLWIEYPTFADADGNLRPDEDTVKQNKEDARN